MICLGNLCKHADNAALPGLKAPVLTDPAWFYSCERMARNEIKIWYLEVVWVLETEVWIPT